MLLTVGDSHHTDKKNDIAAPESSSLTSSLFRNFTQNANGKVKKSQISNPKEKRPSEKQKLER